MRIFMVAERKLLLYMLKAVIPGLHIMSCLSVDSSWFGETFGRPSRDGQMVSVAQSNARGPRFESRWGSEVKEFVNIYHLRLSLVISAKWTEWMADLLLPFDVCVCARARSGPVNQTNLTVKATDFKFDKHVSRDSRIWPLKNFPKMGRL